MSWLNDLPWLSISAAIVVIQTCIIAMMYIIIRGMMKTQQSLVLDYKRHNLTGREREEIRRRLLAQGTTAVHAHEILDLIYSFRAVELGQYKDDDPYVPEDPYDDVEDYQSGRG